MLSVTKLKSDVCYLQHMTPQTFVTKVFRHNFNYDGFYVSSKVVERYGFTPEQLNNSVIFIEKDDYEQKVSGVKFYPYNGSIRALLPRKYAETGEVLTIRVEAENDE